MIAGATYRNGVASSDGAVYVSSLASGTSVPATGVNTAGAGVAPRRMKVDLDGRVYVRFV